MDKELVLKTKNEAKKLLIMWMVHDIGVLFFYALGITFLVLQGMGKINIGELVGWILGIAFMLIGCSMLGLGKLLKLREKTNNLEMKIQNMQWMDPELDSKRRDLKKWGKTNIMKIYKFLKLASEK
ncbi:MAG: hypothetical protein ACRC4L_02330 [Mycoplasma sp.]